MQGSGFQRAMGGTGVAYRATDMVNQLNPASLGNMSSKTVLYNVGLEGMNMYSETTDAKSSFNTFNIRDMSLQMSLAQGMGLSISVTPLTEVGYRIETEETDPSIMANVAYIKYKYSGEGGISQFKVAYGAALSKNVSVGADATYYHGSITRSYSTVFNQTIQPTSTNGTYGTDVIDVAHIVFGVGTQISPILDGERVLTVGATYNFGGDINPRMTRDIETSSIYYDTVYYSSAKYDYVIPGQLNVGASYQNRDMSFSVDYLYQDWAGVNADDEENNVGYFNNNTIKIGAEYTPDRYNMRSFFRRLTYRAGYHYGNYYLTFDDQKLNNSAITLGVSMPMKYSSRSNINFGAEFGKRGTLNNDLILEKYMKFSLEFSFFAEDYWFVKPKYD